MAVTVVPVIGADSATYTISTMDQLLAVGMNVTSAINVTSALNVTSAISVAGSSVNVTNTVIVTAASAQVTGTVTISGSVNSNVTNTIQVTPGTAQTTVGGAAIIRVGVFDTGGVQLSAYYAGLNAMQTVDRGTQYKFCASGATTALGTGTSTGTIGDYLGILNCCVTTVSVGTVQVIDGTLTMNVLPLQVAVGSYVIPLGVTSAIGGWKVLTTSAVSVVACGKFT